MAKRVELLVDMGLDPQHSSKKLEVSEHSYDPFLGWLETRRLIVLVVRQPTAKIASSRFSERSSLKGIERLVTEANI